MPVEQPITGGHVAVEIEGVLDADAGVTSVGFPTSRLEVVAYREGVAQRTRLLAGDEVTEPLVVVRAVEPDSPLYVWWNATRDGQVERRAISVILRDRAGEERVRWNFFECWPSSYTIAELDDGVVSEVVEVVHERMERG